MITGGGVSLRGPQERASWGCVPLMLIPPDKRSGKLEETLIPPPAPGPAAGRGCAARRRHRRYEAKYGTPRAIIPRQPR